VSADHAIEVEFINPFLKGVVHVIKTMANVDCKPGKPFLKTASEPRGDVSGIIGMAAENLKGNMALVFPKACILKIVSSMLYEEFTELTDDVVDALGELTNQICGQAKKGLGEKGYRFEMAIPTMIKGDTHTVDHATKSPVVAIPFTMAEGTFHCEATFVAQSNGAN
jgi:chemotaxis protein CheX